MKAEDYVHMILITTAQPFTVVRIPVMLWVTHLFPSHLDRHIQSACNIINKSCMKTRYSCVCSCI